MGKTFGLAKPVGFSLIIKSMGTLISLGTSTGRAPVVCGGDWTVASDSIQGTLVSLVRRNSWTRFVRLARDETSWMRGQVKIYKQYSVVFITRNPISLHFFSPKEINMFIKIWVFTKPKPGAAFRSPEIWWTEKWFYVLSNMRIYEILSIFEVCQRPTLGDFWPRLNIANTLGWKKDCLLATTKAAIHDAESRRADDFRGHAFLDQPH
jgi:hypothetical protein